MVKVIRVFLLTLILSLTFVSAESIDSSNYKLIDPALSSTNGTATSDSFKDLSTSNGIFNSSRISSSLFKLGAGQAYTFMANVPKLICAETSTTQLTTECQGLPSPITPSGGMIGICGATGCYDRARVELDVQGNPQDTLYSIEISDDNWSTIYTLDGATHLLKPVSSRTITDYQTKASWETSPWDRYNILGLTPNTIYKIRARALHGDFTESGFGPSLSFTTSTSFISIDINIGNAHGLNNNQNYSVNLNKLSPGEVSKTNGQNTSYIKLETNAQNGASVFISSTNGGLRSTNSAYTIPSQDTTDISLENSGFGVVISSVNASPLNSYGVYPKYLNDFPNKVGSVTTTPQLLFCSDTNSSHSCVSPVNSWVEALEVRLDIVAKPDFSAPSETDYSEQLIFTAFAIW